MLNMSFLPFAATYCVTSGSGGHWDVGFNNFLT